MVIYQGQVGASEAEGNSKVVLPNGATAVAVHFGYWGVGGLVFLAVGSDGIVYSVGGLSGNQPVATTLLSNGKIKAVTGQITFINEAEQITLYATDSNQTLSVLNSQAQPWVNGSPVWAPWIPLSGSIAQVVGDMSPADYPSLFTIDSATGELGLWIKDTQGTGRWRQNPILQAGPAAFEVVRYRAEFSVMAGGIPAPNQAVSLSLAPGSSTVDISIAGKAYTLTSDGTPLALTTDSMGKVTVAILVTQTLAAPTLALSAGGVQLATCQVNGAVQAYLNGQTQLNPTNPGGALPTMDASGNTLMGAVTAGGQSLLSPQIKGQPSLVSTASSSIVQLAGMKPGTTTGAPQAGALGFAFSLQRDQPSFKRLLHPNELAAARADLADRFSLSGIWGDIAGFADDVYQGIRAGVITIEGAVVQVVDGIAEATLSMVNQIEQGMSYLVQLAVKGVEDIAHLVVGVFQAIEVAVKDVIDWLKALFDFAAIWRTKVAFESAVTQSLTVISTLLGRARGTLDGWFSEQESALSEAFGSLQQKLGGSSISAFPHFFQPGNPPGPSVPVTANTNTGDVSNNVHHNWLQDKVCAGGPPDMQDAPLPTLDTAVQSFFSSLQAVDSSFAAEFDQFASWFEGEINTASSFGNLAISALLGAVEVLIADLLKLMDSIIDDLIDLLQAAITTLQNVLEQELDLGPINTLWNWIANAAGQPGDSLSILSLSSLLLAFPATVFYKLANGVDTEPFPNGAPWAAMQSSEIRAQLGSINSTVMEVGLFVQLMGALPSLVIDVTGPTTPNVYFYWAAVAELISFACITGLPAAEALLSWIKENAVLAASVLADAIKGLMCLIMSRRNISLPNLSYAQGRQLMGIVGVGWLVFNVYHVISNLVEGDDDLIKVATGVVGPIPSIIDGFVPDGFAGVGLPMGLLAMVNGMIYFFQPILELSELPA